jgi:hypothetical protein
MSTTKTDERYARNQDERYHEKIAEMARRLRTLADDIERKGNAREFKSVLTPRHVNAATNVVHALAWGMANLNADGLVQAAGDADGAEAELGYAPEASDDA